MIDAHEAKELTKNFLTKIDEILQEIEKYIIIAAKKGQYSLIYAFKKEKEIYLDDVLNKLVALNYMIHIEENEKLTTIEINWR